jgi:chemotaxis protein CheD
VIAEFPAAAVVHLAPGQVLATAEPVVLRTILGSCVAVCMWDGGSRTGGMNHFMLPRPAGGREVSPRHGETAMQQLLERMLRVSRRQAIQAYVFGGACLLGGDERADHLGRRNSEFAFEWLEREGIEIATRHVGGAAARRIDFDVSRGRFVVRHVGGG